MDHISLASRKGMSRGERRRHYLEALAHMPLARPYRKRERDVEYWTGFANTRLGRYGQAVSHLYRVIEISPDDATAYCLLLYSLRKCGRLRELWRAFRDYLRLIDRVDAVTVTTSTPA